MGSGMECGIKAAGSAIKLCETVMQLIRLNGVKRIDLWPLERAQQLETMCKTQTPKHSATENL